ncbi:MAG: hypothetical protein M4579_003325 [Chaenotheca gracillima]|nr:MAG: hypothetical protein M4579_003325 [Chaenotheca gracillima]
MPYFDLVAVAPRLRSTLEPVNDHTIPQDTAMSGVETYVPARFQDDAVMTGIEPDFAGPVALRGGKCHLLEMPREIFKMIAGKLDAPWIVSLRYTCKAAKAFLAPCESNKLWFDAMPKAMWTDQERFQPGDELHRLFSDVNSFMVPKLASDCLISWLRGFERRSQSLISHPKEGLHWYTGQTLSSDTTFRVKGYQGKSALMRFPHTKSAGPAPINVDTRTAWSVLVESIAPDDAAYASRDKILLAALWCISNGESRAKSDLCCLADPAKILSQSLMGTAKTPWNKHSPWYYLPEVNEILRNATGLDASAHEFKIVEMLHMKDMIRAEKSIVGKKRSVVRWQIIFAAERIWEGNDPFPEIVISEENGILFEQRMDMPTEDTFRHARERWAPTSSLRHLLFRPQDLTDTPTTLEMSNFRTWLDDPTKYLKTNGDFAYVTDVWICECAWSMIQRLAQHIRPNYFDKGFGGTVDAWDSIIKNWHIARLEQELLSGKTFKLEGVPEEFRGFLLELKEKLGIPKDLRAPSRLRIWIRPGQTREEYVKAFEKHANATTEYSKHLAQFNKIVRASCQRCPITGRLFYPWGIEGLVDHVKYGHPDFFYGGNFHIVG